jgi:prepilin-type N-terminal cleavage/methylation domain-containing protein/prepilin-type processing-associated H-X9-DG protein
MSGRRCVRAFTLIEILVVVAVIAVLIAIILPSLSRAREQARSVVCRSNQKQLMNGMMLYVQDFKQLPGTQSVYYLNKMKFGVSSWLIPRATQPGRLNHVWDGAAGNGSSGSYSFPADERIYTEDVPRRGTIFKYTRDPKLYLCPSDYKGKPDDTPAGGGNNGRLSYSMNAYLGLLNPDRIRGKWRMAVARGTTTISKRWTANQLFVLVEEHPNYNLANGEGNFNVIDRVSTRHSLAIGGGTVSSGSKGRSNIAYLDGHCESVLYTWDTTAKTMFQKLQFPDEQDHWDDGNGVGLKYILFQLRNKPNGSFW